jgi:hypothetical protein
MGVSDLSKKAMVDIKAFQRKSCVPAYIGHRGLIDYGWAEINLQLHDPRPVWLKNDSN